jgi:hypothetical protein
MKYFLFFISFIFYQNNFAQYNYIFSVINNKGVVMPYATIYWGKTSGISANENGVALINSNNAIDTFYITNVGHNQVIHTINNSQKNSDTIKVLLTELNIDLPPITIFANFKTQTFGITEKQTSHFSNQYRNVMAVVKIEQPKSICKVNSISVFINRNAKYAIPFRIRVFNSTNTQLPGTDLLRNSIVINSYKPGEWNVISLSDQNLFIEDKIFFVGIEWLNTSDELKSLEVGLTDKHVDNITYYKLLNKGWKRQISYDGHLDNIMINAQISY